MDTGTVKEGKTIAIISYFHIIGLIIAFIMNQNKHNSFASFHLRQSIGIILLSFIINFIGRFSNFGWIDNLLWLGVFALWIIALIVPFKVKRKKYLF